MNISILFEEYDISINELIGIIIIIRIKQTCHHYRSNERLKDIIKKSRLETIMAWIRITNPELVEVMDLLGRDGDV